eukprot:TRINITY_DN37644_c0_g1_i1.p1 TRINITY_DN37644_c0_g1~~TRINITY_DN37644_c0_g1_i1.p1  ORF type:complete len:154 (+),score=74.75 TRINITY_DN37644_c0_g1_i1:45-464(+)
MLRSLLLAACVVMVAGLEKKGSNQHLWRDTEMTTNLWRMCSQGNLEELKALVEDQPDAVHMRSNDGRGPLWWASEHKQKEVYDFLVSKGANPGETDVDGRTAVEMDEPDLTDYAKAEAEAKRKELDEMETTDEMEEEDY